MASTYYDAYYSGDTAHRIKLQLHIYTVATDLANLKTTERADLYMVVSNASSGWWNNYGSEAYVGIGGNDKTTTVNFDARTTGNKTLISSWDTVVTHNSDGSKGIGISAHHYSGVGLGNATIEPQIYYCDTLTVTPSFTTNPSITGKTETSVTVNRGATNISSNFYYSTDNSNWTKFTAETATITGLSANTSYTIYVQARNANNESYKTSKSLSVTTYANPSQSLSSKTEIRITMNWSLDTEADYLWYMTKNSGSWIAAGSVSGTSGSYTITGLTPGTNYYIKTRLRRKATQTTSYSSVLHVTTYSVPTQRAVTKSEVGIQMGWEIDSTADYVWYSINNGSSWVEVGSTDGTSGIYAIRNLTAGTTYNIKTRIRRKATQTTYDTTTLSVKTYALPTQSLASKTETSITMNWSLDSAADQLYYSTNGGTSWSDAVAVSGTSGTYTITGLSANTNYEVLLRLRRAATLTNVQPSSATSVTTYQYPYITGIEKTSLTIGEEQTITIYNPIGRNVYVAMRQNSTSGTQLYIGTTTGTTAKFTPSQNTLYSSIPNNQSGTAVYYVAYVNQIVTTKSGTYKIKGTEKPTFTNFAYEDTDSRISALTGNNQIIVNGYSDIKVTISSANKATGNNSATISKYRITIGSVSQEATYSSSADVTSSFTNRTSQVISVTAIDSRGLETTVSKAVTYKNYEQVVIKKLSVMREDGIGTKVYFSIQGTYWNDNFGNVDNDITTAYYRWREVGGDYSSFIDITNSFSSADGTFENISNAFLPTTDNGTVPQEFQLGKQYEIQFNVRDKLNDAYWYAPIIKLDSGIPCVDRIQNDDGTYSVGINQLAEDNVALAITGGLKVDGEEIKDNVKISTSEPSTNEKVWLKHSKNIFNMYNYSQANSNRGFLLNSSGELYKSNGSIDSSLWAYSQSNYYFYLKAGTYTLSIIFSTTETNASAGYMILDSNSNQLAFERVANQTNMTKTITLSSDTNIGFMIKLSNGVCKFKLEKGNSATAYEPYVSNEIYVNDNGNYNKFSDSIEASAYPTNSKIWLKKSENLLNAKGYSISSNGLSVTYDDYGNLILNGTTTGIVDLYIISSSFNNDLLNYMNKNYNTYTLSNSLDLENFFKDTAGYHYNSSTTTYSNHIAIAFIRVASGKTYSNQQLKIMLNIGTTAKIYEPYVTTQPYIHTDNGYEEYFPAVSNYSTRETRIGTWIDGKPLYRKTYNITSGFSTALNINHNISNIDYCKCYGTLITGDITIEQFYASSTDYFRCFRDVSLIKIRYGTDNNPTTIVVNLEYTKTTD